MQECTNVILSLYDSVYNVRKNTMKNVILQQQTTVLCSCTARDSSAPHILRYLNKMYRTKIELKYKEWK